MNKTGKLWSRPASGVEVSDLRAQLIAKLGVVPPEADEAHAEAPVADPLGANAHLDSEWMKQLLVDARMAGMDLGANASLGKARQTHDVLAKQLKAQGRKREKAVLDDLRSRYLKKREKLAWSRLKAKVDASGLSAKLYRSLKQSGVDPEVLLQRWQRTSKQSLNQAELREALLRKP